VVSGSTVTEFSPQGNQAGKIADGRRAAVRGCTFGAGRTAIGGETVVTTTLGPDTRPPQAQGEGPPQRRVAVFSMTRLPASGLDGNKNWSRSPLFHLFPFVRLLTVAGHTRSMPRGAPPPAYPLHARWRFFAPFQAAITVWPDFSAQCAFS
jgi:hypothetical protein